MYPPKPPDLDAQGNPRPKSQAALYGTIPKSQVGVVGKDDVAPPDLDAWGNPRIPEQNSIAKDWWNAANESLTTAPHDVGQAISHWIDPDRSNTGLRAVASAAAENVGDTVGQMFTSPIGIGTLGLAPLASGALRAGLPTLSKGFNYASKLIGGGFAGQGAYDIGKAGYDVINDPNTSASDAAQRALMGTIGVVTGYGAMTHEPTAHGPISSYLDRKFPQQMESAFGPAPAKPTPTQAPSAGTIPQNIAPPETITIKKGKSAQRDIVEATQKGFILTGESDAAGNFVMKRPPDPAKPTTPTTPQGKPYKPQYAPTMQPYEQPSYAPPAKPRPSMGAWEQPNYAPPPEPPSPGPEFGRDQQVAPLPQAPENFPRQVLAQPTEPMLEGTPTPQDAGLTHGMDLRPYIPPEQQTNQRILDYSNQRARENATAGPPAQQQYFGGHEFQQDQPLYTQPVPETGGTTVTNEVPQAPPEFGEQVLQGQPPLADLPLQPRAPTLSRTPAGQIPLSRSEFDWGPNSQPDFMGRLPGDAVQLTPSGQEVHPPEVENDIFGIPKNRDLTPEEVEHWKRQMDQHLMSTYGEDTVEGQRAVDDLHGIIDLRPSEAKFRPQDALSTRGMDDPVAVAINEAKHLGLNPDDYPDLGELQWAITRRTAQETQRTGKNPLSDPSYSPEGRPDYEHFNLGEHGLSRAETPGEEDIGMKIGNPKDILRDKIAQYAEHGTKVATKELLQNALDALHPSYGRVGHINVDLNYHGDPSVSIHDDGPGLPLETIRNEFTTMTGSGKRGKGVATIGEMGVGKTTYLLGADRFHVETVAKEPDGTTWHYVLEGDPEAMLDGTVKLQKTQMPDGTPTGTTVTVFDSKAENITKAENWLKNFAQYSNPHTEVTIKGNQYRSSSYQHMNTNVTIPARAQTPGKFVSQGSAPGGDFTITVPDGAHWGNTTQMSIVIQARGMFQGVDSTYVGTSMGLPVHAPDHVVVDVNPTVPATDAKKYPLTSPTRERMREDFKNEVTKSINTNLVEAAKKKQEANIQKAFDDLTPKRGASFVIHNSGDRYTPQEIDRIYQSPHMNIIADTMKTQLQEMHRLFPVGPDGQLGITKKYGFVLDKPELGGINIPNPAARLTNANSEFAVLMNPFASMMNIHSGGLYTPAEAARRMVHLTMHEFTHNMARSEGAGYTWALSRVETMYPLEQQLAHAKRIERAITGPNGSYASEVQNLLRQYTTARGRPDASIDILSRARESEFAQGGKSTGVGTSEFGGIPNATGISRTRYTDKLGRFLSDEEGSFNPDFMRSEAPDDSMWVRDPSDMNSIKSALEQGYEFSGDINAQGHWKFNKAGTGRSAPILEADVAGHRPTIKGARQQLGTWGDKPAANKFVDVVNAPRAIMASGDMSGALRQGIGLIHKKGFWKAIPEMFSAWNSEEGFNASQQAIAERPLFRKRYDARGNEYNSFAEDAGLKLTDLHDMNSREESFVSSLVDKYPGVRRANRAYVAFLNNLRADTFESLAKDMKVFGADAKANLPLSREVAQFVNSASGRGSLGSLESSAGALSGLLFSPRLIASRLQMMTKGGGALFSPETYVFSKPSIRREYLKSLIAIAAAGNTLTTLGKYGAQAMGFDAAVSQDPSSSDFGKLRIGNTRLDPYGGFQQYIVAANRLLNPIGPATGFQGDTPFTRGQMVTSTEAPFNEYDLHNPETPFAPTYLSTVGRLGWSKTNPALNFAISLMNNGKNMEGKQMNFTSMNPLENSIGQMFVPLVMQDIYDIAKDDPRLLPLAVLGVGGMGMQTYGTQNYNEVEQ